MRAVRRGRPSPPSPAPVPERPVGAKLELTHRCNLRCSFCYTDSPRRTLEGALDLDDDRWLHVVDELIGLGLLEAVVTGGEPLLRRDLALEILSRLDDAGVSTTLSTNGWFLDDAVCDELEQFGSLCVQVSIDGATPALHEASRGVPGSWRRAIEGVSRLLDRGMRVRVSQVVSPANEHGVGDFLDAMWTLGVPVVRIVPVIEVGAASRARGQWSISARRLERTVREFRERRGDAVDVAVQTDDLEFQVAPPAAMLIRPSGTVRTDSLHPFAFGNVRRDPVIECWNAIRAHWRDPRIESWEHAASSALKVGGAPITPYAEDDVQIAGDASPPSASARSAERVSELLARPFPDAHDDGSQREIADLALGRRYRLGDVRATAGIRGGRYVHLVGTGRICRLNATAAAVLDACDDGTPADAVAALADRHPAVELERLRTDVLAATRWLAARGVLVPALARRARNALVPAGPLR